MATTKKTVKKFGSPEKVVQIVKDASIDIRAKEIPGVGCMVFTEGTSYFVPNTKIIEVYSNGKVSGRDIVSLRKV